MGTGIAEVCGRADLDVLVVEVDAEARDRSRNNLEGSLARAAARGKITEEDARSAMARVNFETEFESLSDRQLIIEAAVESKVIKRGIFERLAAVVEDPDAVLASNTSSIPIVELATAANGGRGRVLGLHFFNPVPVMSLVEVIPSLLTDPEVTERAHRFATQQLGKESIEAPDRAGFTVNALLIPYLLSAIRMFEQGLASAEDIDHGMVRGCGHPMGPLALCDLIGLDTVLGVAETLYTEQREQLFAPPALLQRLVAAGLLGRKTGRGLYSY
jgi:3-hydroxybutyryl-CoA dehydrogenase